MFRGRELCVDEHWEVGMYLLRVVVVTMTGQKRDGERGIIMLGRRKRKAVYARKVIKKKKNEGHGRTEVVQITTKMRYLSGWGSADANFEAGSRTGSEEEEDGELDPARILVPPKRQNSIKSLRKHGVHAATLSKHYVAGAGTTGPLVDDGKLVVEVDAVGVYPGYLGSCNGERRPQIMNDEDGERHEEWGVGWVRNCDGGAAGNRESEDDSFVGRNLCSLRLKFCENGTVFFF